jgi:hypothetical protein
MKKDYHEKSTSHWYIVTCLLLQPLKQRFIDVTSFRVSKSLYSESVPFKRTDSFGSVFTARLDRRISSRSPSLFYLLVHSRCTGFLIFHLITLKHTAQLVGVLWTRDRPVAETST